MPKTRSPKNQIRRALLGCKEATWTQLLDETKLSKGALSKHLKELIEYGQVKTNTDDSKRPPSTKYSLIQINKEDAKHITQKMARPPDYRPKSFLEMQRILLLFSMQVGNQISMLDDRQKAKELLKEYLSFNLDTLSASVPVFILAAFAYSRGYMHGQKNPKKQHQIFLKHLKAHFMKEFIEPWIESLADTAFWNQDISVSVKKGGAYPFYAMEKGKNLTRVHSTFFDKAQELY